MGCFRDRTQQSLKREGSAARSNPLPFYTPFLTENESIPSINKWYPFHIPSLVKNFVSLTTALNALSLKYE